MEGGSKTIDRVGAILRALEHGPQQGMMVAQVAEATGFDKATTYRAMVSMERTGLIDRDPESRRFRLGVYLFSLGAKTAQRFSILNLAREALESLVHDTSDTVFLSVRNKYDSVCIDSLCGSYPIKAQTLSIGERVPLGLSAGGLAMLATMTDEEVQHAMQYNAAAIKQFHRLQPEQIYQHVQETRVRGYAHYSGHIIAGMSGVARAIRDARGKGVAVLSVTALLDRMSAERVQFIAQKLQECVLKVEQKNVLFSHWGHSPHQHGSTSP